MRSLGRVAVKVFAGALCSLSLAVFAAPSFAGEAKAPAASGAKKPVIQVEPANFELGTMGDDESKKATFTIKNAGDAELVIIDAKPACGCTVANISSKQIPPGGTATLDAVYNAHNASGLVRKNVTIRSNDPANGSVNVSLSATVVPKPAPNIRLSRYEVPNLEMPKGGRKTETVEIISEGQEELVINEMTTTAGLSVKLDQGEVAPGTTGKVELRLKPGEKKAIELTVAPSAPAGNYVETLTIRSNARKMPAARVRVQGVIKG